jgi:large subunit ribosomal protein L24
LKIKTGDTVRVIRETTKASEGKVLRVDRDQNKAIVEGVNDVSKHEKPSAQQPPRWHNVEKEAPIHISNLSLSTQNPVRPLA